MSNDTSSKSPINPTDEVDKEKSSGKPEDNKKNSQHEEEEDKLETTDDEMSFQGWKAWKKKQKLQRKKEKFNTKIVIKSSDDSGIDCFTGCPLKGIDRRLSPDLPRGTVNFIGGELNVDDPRLRTNRTPQLLHHYSVGYHPCHTNDLATKAYPCKRN
jgi:hypothetical protein